MAAGSGAGRPIDRRCAASGCDRARLLPVLTVVTALTHAAQN
jgi:hypothetical protein